MIYRQAITSIPQSSNNVEKDNSTTGLATKINVQRTRNKENNLSRKKVFYLFNVY